MASPKPVHQSSHADFGDDDLTDQRAAGGASIAENGISAFCWLPVMICVCVDWREHVHGKPDCRRYRARLTSWRQLGRPTSGAPNFQQSGTMAPDLSGFAPARPGCPARSVPRVRKVNSAPPAPQEPQVRPVPGAQSVQRAARVRSVPQARKAATGPAGPQGVQVQPVRPARPGADVAVRLAVVPQTGRRAAGGIRPAGSLAGSRQRERQQGEAQSRHLREAVTCELDQSENDHEKQTAPRARNRRHRIHRRTRRHLHHLRERRWSAVERAGRHRATDQRPDGQRAGRRALPGIRRDDAAER